MKGDLEIVVQAALRQEPQLRYASAEEFAGDLKAFLVSRPIRARQGDRAYRARKLARRYWLPATLAGAIAATALSAGGLVWYRSRPVSTPKTLRPERLTANTPELPVLDAAISPDGKFVAYSDPLGIHSRDMVSGVTRLLPGTNGHVLVQWLPDGARLQTSVQDDGKVKMMTVFLSGSAPVPAPTSDTWVVSPNGKLRAMVPADHQRLLIQDAAGGNPRELWRAAAKSAITGFQWSPNTTEIFSPSENKICRHASIANARAPTSRSNEIMRRGKSNSKRNPVAARSPQV